MSFLDTIQSPPPEFSPAAFWFWYGEIKPERMRHQINLMAEQGVYNAFMHARAYLKTPYLEEEWWQAISACIDEANKIGFYTWLYDEYAWPSGTAGSTFKHGYQKPSLTLSKGKCNMSKSLAVRRYTSADILLSKIDNKNEYESLLAVFYKKNGKWHMISDISQAEGEVMAFFLQIHPRFVDYMNPETIREFMDYTHEEYKKRYSEYFGKCIPGIFFDEIFMINKMPWTGHFKEEFIKRRGYDLMPKLYALADVGDEEVRRIRNDYFITVSELYEETFFKQISEWCQENNLELTGHIEEFFVQHPGRQGQFFNNMRHLNIPGADCHDYRYRFPRKITYREPKFSVSVARAYGKKRMMSEALGGAGWGCSLEQFKRGINTLGAMGINMITLHGFYSECGSQGTQADWPSSFFYQNPYWRYFKYFANYINRICYINTQGSPVVDVGLYYPIDEMQTETIAGAPTKAGCALDKAWNGAMNTLIEHQIDVDIIDEECLLVAKVTEGRICVGVQAFRVLLFPDIALHSLKLREKLAEFVESGGTVLYYACGKECAGRAIKTEDLPEVISSCFQPDVVVLRGTRDNLYINHRKIEGKDVYLIANSAPRSRSMTLLLREKGGVQKLSPENGMLSEIKFKNTESGTEVDLTLEADEACWLVVDADYTGKIVQEEIVLEEVSVAGKWEFMPVDANLSGEEQLKTEGTVLKIPLAAFSSQIHPDGRQIRIQNTENEEGCCRRHLSLWKASWITRRPDWTDSSMKKMLCFRRRITLEDKPDAARICIAAVNEWTMWINGREVEKSSKARIPSVVDIGEFLTSGENIIAVKVINETPMEHFNLLSVDELPPEELISLLAQAEITVDGKTITVCSDNQWEVNDELYEGWEKASYKTHLRTVHSSSAIMFGDDEGIIAGNWTQSWERGCPPLLPWGDLPLFGKMVSYPQRVCYSVILPAGTSRILYPEITGSDISVTVDGMPMLWDNGKCTLKPDGIAHQLQIAVTVNSGEEGLHSSVGVDVIPFRTALFDWRLHGLKWFSGFARYRNTLRIKKEKCRYLLTLGQVNFQAEVWVNGVWAGDRVWEPYNLDVTDLIKDGDNEFVVIVSNSAAVERQYMLVDEGMALGWNRYWNDDNIQREGENLVSGMMGPVQLIKKS